MRKLDPAEKKSAHLTLTMTQKQLEQLHFVSSALGKKPQEFLRSAIETVYEGFMEEFRKEKL